MRKPSTLAKLIVIIVALAAYAATLSNGFVYDDVPQVLENIWIIDFSNIPKIFTSSVWSFMGEEQSFHYYRPMMHTIYAVEYKFFFFNPLYWHLVNVVIHALNALLVFLLASILLSGEARGVGSGERGGFIENFPLLPFIAAIFFALHPVMTESVAWVAAIPELTYTTFFLLSLYLYIKASKSGGQGVSSSLLRPSYILSVIFFFLSLFCKEPAMMLIPVLFAYDYSARRRFFTLSSVLRYLPFFILAVIYLFIRNSALGGLGPKFTEHYYLSTYQNLLNIGPLVFKYALSLIVPMRFSPFYVFYPVLSLAEFSALYSWALILALCAVYIYLFKKRGVAFVAATLLLMPLLPVLYIPALSTSVFAVRYLYLPVAGFTILMALVVKKILTGYKPVASRLSIKPIIIAFVLLVLLSVSAYKTVTRAVIWADEITLWTETKRMQPDNYHVYLNFGRVYMASGEKELAKEAYKKAIRLNLALKHRKNVQLARSWYNLGLLQFETGEIENAINSYERSLEIKVSEKITLEVLNNLGNAYATAGRKEKAIRSYERALLIDPSDIYLRHNLEEVRKWK